MHQVCYLTEYMSIFVFIYVYRFDPNGEMLAVGYSNGILKLLYSDSLSDVTQYNIGNDAILECTFCPSGTFLACYDSAGYLMIFKKPVAKNTSKPIIADKEGIRSDKDVFIYLGVYVYILLVYV